MTELLKNTEGLNLAHLFIDWNPIHKDNYKMLPEQEDPYYAKGPDEEEMHPYARL